MNNESLEALIKATQSMDMVCSDIHELCAVRDEPFLAELASEHLRTAVKLHQDLKRMLTLAQEVVAKSEVDVDLDAPAGTSHTPAL